MGEDTPEDDRIFDVLEGPIDEIVKNFNRVIIMVHLLDLSHALCDEIVSGQPVALEPQPLNELLHHHTIINIDYLVQMLPGLPLLLLNPRPHSLV